MSTTEIEATKLKSLALKELGRAEASLIEALELLSRFEGKGYCENYEAIRDLEKTLMSEIGRFSNLRKPTGVFTV